MITVTIVIKLAACRATRNIADVFEGSVLLREGPVDGAIGWNLFQNCVLDFFFFFTFLFMTTKLMQTLSACRFAEIVKVSQGRTRVGETL